jgi:hypothetical protein
MYQKKRVHLHMHMFLYNNKVYLVHHTSHTNIYEIGKSRDSMYPSTSHLVKVEIQFPRNIKSTGKGVERWNLQHVI